MYLAANGGTADRSADSAGSGATRWLIDRERGASAAGRIGLIDIASGGAAVLSAQTGGDRLGFVLRGNGVVDAAGTTADIRDGSLIIPATGAPATVWAGDRGLRLLLVESEPERAGAIAGSEEERARAGAATAAGQPPRVRHLDELENVSFHRPALGFLHVAARWLMGGAAAPSTSLVVGQSTFVPGAAHLLHRHDHADEFFFLFEGRGAHLVEGGEVAMAAGDAVFAPRGEWHGFRNAGERPARAVFGYFGVAALDEAGYEVHEQVGGRANGR